MLVIVLAVLLILSVIKMSNDKIKTSDIKGGINEMMVPPEVSAGEESPSDDWMVPPNDLENNEVNENVPQEESVPSDGSSAGSSESYDDASNPDAGLNEEKSPSDDWRVAPDLY